jgi:hypothetical protein
MTGSREDTNSNPKGNPDPRSDGTRLKDLTTPENKWKRDIESVDVIPRVVIKLKDPETFSGQGFSAAELFIKGSVDAPDFAENIRFKPHFRPGLVKCINQRFLDMRRDDMPGEWRNLEAYHSVVVEDAKQVHWLLEELPRLDSIRTAYLHPGAVLPPDVHADDDSLSSKQTYLDKAPYGINARYAWTVPGGDGKNMRLADVEWGWNLDHEDLEGINFTNLRAGNYKALAHGTSVLGVIAARDNKKHCVGITPHLPSIVTSGQWDSNNKVDSDEAILEAILELEVGDVLLLEAQTEMYGYKNLPLEAEPAVFDLVWIATYLGAVVVAAAGNGDVDLDAVTNYNGKHIFQSNGAAGWYDSGAIIVGCGYFYDKEWNPFNNSSYGSRIDCFADGDGVVTLYSDYDGEERDKVTSTFSATSAASAIVAGACIAVQSILDEKGKPRLTSRGMRAFLSNPEFNTKTENHPDDLIGVMPNLKEIIARL